MSNFFQLCNKVLQELSLQQKTSFDQFTTRLDQDILTQMSDLCKYTTFDVKFEERIRNIVITVPANTISIPNPLEGIGEIKVEEGGIIDIPNSQTYHFDSKHEHFLLQNADDSSYGMIGTQLLFNPNVLDRQLTVYYYTYSSAIDDLGNDQDVLTNGTDIPIIPEHVQELILVNGTCLNIKKRGDNTRVPHWTEHLNKGKNYLRATTQNEDSASRFEINHRDRQFVRNISKPTSYFW